jgi:hypothetical protein
MSEHDVSSVEENGRVCYQVEKMVNNAYLLCMYIAE